MKEIVIIDPSFLIAYSAIKAYNVFTFLAEEISLLIEECENVVTFDDFIEGYDE